LRVTTTLLHPEFPAASNARVVTRFEPINRGIDADQFVVPVAVPDCPKFVDHTTDVTPTLSLAVPLNAIVGDEVEIELAPGTAIVKDGAAVSVAGAACLVTVTTCDT